MSLESRTIRLEAKRPPSQWVPLPHLYFIVFEFSITAAFEIAPFENMDNLNGSHDDRRLLQEPYW